MAHVTKQTHKFGFYMGTAGLTDQTVGTFTVDGVPVSADVLSSLSFVDLSGGFYYAEYTPDTTGEHLLMITSASATVHGAIEIIDIEDESVVFLNQNHGGTNALRPTLPIVKSTGPIKNTLDQYILMIFSSDDWDVGRKSPNYAIAMTQLDGSGNWTTQPIAVATPGTYHLVIKSNFGTEKVIKAYLEV